MNDRMRIYRVLIRADVASRIGEDWIREEIEDMFENLDHWDVIEVEVRPRREDEDGITE